MEGVKFNITINMVNIEIYRYFVNNNKYTVETDILSISVQG